MKSTNSDLFLTVTMIVVAVTVTTCLATPIFHDGSPTPIKRSNDISYGIRIDGDEPPIGRGENKKIGGTTCLSIAPDLPPCNFDSQATWRSTSSEIFHDTPSGSMDYQSDSIAKFSADFNSENIHDDDTIEQRDDGTPSVSGTDSKKNLEDIDSYENDLAVTIVYYLEGCLPSRLPFDLPPCNPIAELLTIRMNKLIPFKLPNVEDALIFPDIDVKKIKFPPRQTRIHPVYSSRKEIEAAEDPYLRDDYPNESTGVSLAKVFGIRTTSSSLRDVEEDEGGTRETSSHEFQSSITRKSINPMIGIAMTKYARKLSASGQPSPISSTTVNRQNNNHNIDNQG